MSGRPLIGISPLYDNQMGNMWMLDNYMAGIEMAGGIPLMLSISASAVDADQIFDHLDGFLFPGGQDLFPLHYGEQVLDRCAESCPQLDELELMLVHKVRHRGLPILGICRGIQLLNVALGGTLYQDLPSQLEGATPLLHHQRGRVPQGHPIHTVSVASDSRLHQTVGVAELPVNSFHHQGIKDLASGLVAVATATDGLIEGVEGTGGSFLLAVQWHPELLFHRDESARQIFRLFVDACR